jgi:hypothetical protein
LGDLLGRERRDAAPALRAAGRERDYRRALTTAWKTGNFLSHLGVRTGSRVAVAGRAPEALLAFLGAGSLGACVRFRPPGTPIGADGPQPRVLVTPIDRTPECDPPSGRKRVVYGDAPDAPGAAHFERDVWSENPVEPPERPAPSDRLLAGPDAQWTHVECLDAARGVATAADLDAEDAVAVRAPLSDPGTVVAGILAPLLVGAAVLVPADGTTGTVAVSEDGVDEEVPEERAVAPA